MCGIVGAISGQGDVSGKLLEGLRRLEYRGYDSAGIAVIDGKGHLKRIRTSGKVEALVNAVREAQFFGLVGIAHTRWATHGKPSEQNAHPHMSHNEIAVVHNGIIENHESLRRKLQGLGYEFASETDTEVAAHLIHYHYQTTSNLIEAVLKAAKMMEGAFALGILHEAHPKELVAIRKGSPLIAGFSKEAHYIASDPLALRGFAHEVIYLEEGDLIHLTEAESTIYDTDGHRVSREKKPLSQEGETTTRGTYRHFMLKEIFEQGDVLQDTLEGRISSIEMLRKAFGEKAGEVFPKVRHVHIVACGTSYHAGLVARYWIESLANISVHVEIASEYRYRDVVIDENTLFVAISQSGETADTLAALYKARTLSYLSTLAICNVPTSTLVREATSSFLTRAGIEIGVASTKAFTTQLAALLMLAAVLSPEETGTAVLNDLSLLPVALVEALQMNDEICKLASRFVNKEHALFLGRGISYPVALEGALKLKEISYIHAEAYPAGELKHGPLALVDKNMPVVAIAPNDELLDKLKSNLHEVSARSGELIVFVDANESFEANGATLLRVPTRGRWIAPMIYTIPLQLLAYHVACAKGTDVDQPRNLAKSVTVE